MASEEDSLNNITLKGTPVTELKVTDIKRELEKRGLSKSGSKTQLTERLKAQLLLEKLQQDAAQSSGDELEGKAPNIALQQDNKAGQSEFVRQYLEQQQRNLEIQMEVKKQVEEERKRKSADESSADESNAPAGSQVTVDPDVTSPKKFKDDTSNAPAKSKEIGKMPRPARKSSRTASKGENGQEVEPVKDRSRSPTPENERLRERTRSGSSSSSRSPTPEKPSRSRRGRQARGRASKRGTRRRGKQPAKESRSSSSSSQEATPKKKRNKSGNSVSSRSRSRSPQIVASDVITTSRRSTRRSAASSKIPVEEPPHEDLPDDGGGSQSKSKPVAAKEIPTPTKVVTTAHENITDKKVQKSPDKARSHEEPMEVVQQTTNLTPASVEDEKTQDCDTFTEAQPVAVEKKETSTLCDSQAKDVEKTHITDTMTESKTVDKQEPEVEKMQQINVESEKKIDKDVTEIKEDTVVPEIKSTVMSENKDVAIEIEKKQDSDNETEKKQESSENETENKPDTKQNTENKEGTDHKKHEKQESETSKSLSVQSFTESVEPSERLETPEPQIEPNAEAEDKSDKSVSSTNIVAPDVAVTAPQVEVAVVAPQVEVASVTPIEVEEAEPPAGPETVQPPGERLNKTNLDSEKSEPKVASKESPVNSPKDSKNKRSRSSSSSSSSSRSRSKSPAPKRKASRSESSSSSRSRSRSSSSSSSSDSSSKGKQRKADQVITSKRSPISVSQGKFEAGDKDEPMEEAVSEAPKEENLVKTSDQLTSSVSPTENQAKKLKDQKSPSNESSSLSTTGGGDADTCKDDTTKVVSKEADSETTLKKDKGAKKRKWGSKTSKAAKTVKRATSLEISSDSLKNLIGDVKLTESVFDIETEEVNTLDYDEHEEDHRDVKVKRIIVQSPRSDEDVKEDEPAQEDARKVEARDDRSDESHSEPEKKIIKISTTSPKDGGKKKLKEGKKLKKKKDDVEEKENTEVKDTEKEKEKVFATTRSSKALLPVVDEPEPVKNSQSPARNPPNRVIRIAGLVRPFTIGQLKELLKRSGELDDEYFWINDIKSHCLAAYKSDEDAVKARAALHGTRWPQSNPKILIVDFATVEDVIHRKTEGDVPLPALVKRPVEDSKKIKEQKEDEEREKRLKLREQREREEKEKETREKRDARDRRREAERKNPIREWDRDKVQQLSKSRSRSKERERPARRSRSRDREQLKRREHSREKKDDERRKEKKSRDVKGEEEPPAKLLDDLFRKTKATPCIYWLPLTEEQSLQRLIKKQELEKERQKRIAAKEEREKEELKRREAARLERQRERERERERSRERERNRQERSRSSRSDSRSRSRRRR
ncbi:apoptotic chromatin condensation inducer in the nucleus-like isoform X3 [Physella acuta]|uniref:apoptotic chromatin condensation inducer in the nucleus-like isoform X3 n=1 Tax=Physella acuta TaxID=109671 RepID=UPI0027DB734B|nr:apoptotic chromatin condensation inducer in the nucleus-like isoform X3 [Physella acuta]